MNRLFKHTGKRQGIVLITTMLLLTIIIMIATLLAMSAHSGMKLGRNYSDGERAYYAAVSGLEYARARIYSDSAWMQTNTSPSPINFPGISGISVTEDNGLVSGVIGGVGNSSHSEFFIAFNETAALNTSANVNYISCNNIARTDSFSKKKNDLGSFYDFKKVPGDGVYLIVKGISNGVIRYAEAYITPTSSSPINSPSVARGDIGVSLLGPNPTFRVNAAAGTSTDIRSANDILVESAAGNKNCFELGNTGTAFAKRVFVNPAYKYEGIVKTPLDPLESTGSNGIVEEYGININTSDVVNTEKILEAASKDINWQKLTTNNSDEGIGSGAYLYDKASGTWQYYENVSVGGLHKDQIKLLAGGKNFNNVNRSGLNFYKPGEVVSAEVTADMPRVSVTANVVCRGDLFIGVVEDINKTNADGFVVLSATDRAKINFEEGGASLEVGSPVKAADLVLQGEVTGKGKIFSKGNVYLQGGSYFDTEKNSGVSVYAEKDVEVLPSTTTKYVAAYNELVDNGGFLQTIWAAFATAANGKKFDSEADAAAFLLGYLGQSDKTLGSELSRLGCKDEREQLLFAEMVISKNSARVGSGFDGTVENPLKFDLLSSSLENVDTIDMSGGNFNDASVDIFVATLGNDDIEVSGYLQHHDPYISSRYKSYDWISANFGDYKAYMTVNLRNSSFQYVLGTKTSAETSQTLNKIQQYTGNFLEVWLHMPGPTGVGEPDDLFVYIPISSDGSIPSQTPVVRLGLDKITGSDYKKAMGNYKYELCTSLSQFNSDIMVVDSVNGTCSLNSQAVFKALKAETENVASSKVKVMYSHSSTDNYIQGKTSSSNGLYFSADQVSDWNAFWNSFQSTNKGVTVADRLNRIEGLLNNFKYTGDSMTSAKPDDFVIDYSGNKLQIGKYVNQTDSRTDTSKDQGKEFIKMQDAMYSDTMPGVNDSIIRGMIYTRHGNFKADAAGGSITVRGGVVAYGKDDSGALVNGQINIINAGAVNMCYDPDYMQFFYYGDKTLTKYVYRGVF